MEKSFEHKITASHRLFDLKLKEVVSYKDLIALFVRREFVANYRQTILGPLWAILQPLLTTFVYAFIFGMLAGLSASGVPTILFYLSGSILWLYFASSFTLVARTFRDNSRVMSKVYFPRLVMPISSVISKLISFSIQFVMFMLVLLGFMVFKTEININFYALMLPLVVLELGLLALGFGIIISSITVKYRDLAMLITFGVEIWKYLTPIAYDMDKIGLTVGSSFYALYMLNPVTSAVNVFRFGFLGIGSIDWTYYLISWAVTLVILFIGAILFNKVERTFADMV